MIEWMNEWMNECNYPSSPSTARYRQSVRTWTIKNQIRRKKILTDIPRDGRKEEIMDRRDARTDIYMYKQANEQLFPWSSHVLTSSLRVDDLKNLDYNKILKRMDIDQFATRTIHQWQAWICWSFFCPKFGHSVFG